MEVKIGRELRTLQHVKRWAMIRTIRTQTVAEHSLMVAFLVDRFGAYLDTKVKYFLDRLETNRDRLARKAAYHDLGEILSGDLAHPAKTAYRAVPGAKEEYIAWEERRLVERFPWIGGNEYAATKDERMIIGLMDMLEANLFLMEEQRLGNSEVNAILAAVGAKLFEAVDHFEKVYGVEVKPFCLAACHEVLFSCDTVVHNYQPGV